jgi:hypothetical protein
MGDSKSQHPRTQSPQGLFLWWYLLIQERWIRVFDRLMKALWERLESMFTAPVLGCGLKVPHPKDKVK